jgi:hypothetical protein
MKKVDSMGKLLYTEATIELWDRQLKLVDDDRLSGESTALGTALCTVNCELLCVPCTAVRTAFCVLGYII